jgi:hypothetical protein
MRAYRVGCLALTVVLGCGSGGNGYGPEDNPTTLRDVTGVEFGWDCDASGCQVGLLASTPPPDPCGGDSRAAYGYAWGRFFEICSVCVSADNAFWSTFPSQCRILACDTSDDCPIIYPYASVYIYECVNGLCQDADQNRRPRTTLDRTETEQLCYAALDRTETSDPFSAASLAVDTDLDASCTGPNPMDTCSLPTACRAP